MFSVQTFDNIVPEDERKAIWDYIENQTWHVFWKPLRYDGESYDFIPSEEKRWRNIDPARLVPSMFMPRAGFASDDLSLEKNHPIIYKLWKRINAALGDEFVIEGAPEGFSTDGNGDPKWVAPPTANPNIEQGWRVYANSQPSESIKRSHGIHRDTVDLADTTSYTLLYVANLEWFPSWFAECIYYPNDVKKEIGDFQQYQSVLHSSQNRNFNIGWADDGKIVSPKPGRVILYDGRTLHTTRPAAIWAKAQRKVIAFRVRKIK